ncbi:SGNH/GDSL hydrolase family protein [Mycoplasma hyopneumoniae]|uniref:SGNH/GDSL family surface lipase p65 n=1 Tax=Mesomycoplasma hyopneumoniae TaxID=2099 RepID=UPI00137099D7|nr:SGNH/GDSL family surface lipase p65 [Mesomycoplasma hyopneumoniae]MXR10959.1 SGNH/GDSL hydrolase family protein [Mesomycoplasma hyopneumoniae]MXR63788.1 SGNH/GDSL hydrolase family protein [Mesomycoplasma hyopneumoniae]
MKKKARKFLRLTSLTLAPFSVFTTLISAGCLQKNSLLSEVNYLALGDSLTAGFNEETYRDFQGTLDKDGNLSGQSYPAYFAYYLQKLNKNSLVSYDNLAISGTTTENWLYLLNPTKYPNGKMSDNPLVTNYSGNEKYNEIGSVFGDFNKDSYPGLVEKVKKANLLTMSVGANDPFLAIFNEFKKWASIIKPKSEEAKKLLDPNERANFLAEKGMLLMAEVNKKIEEINTNLDNLIKELKALNPKLSINLIGYKLPNSGFIKILKYLLYTYAKIETDFINEIPEKINKIIRETAIKNKVNYIDVYDKSIWNDSDKNLMAKNFDFHPSIQGYKKIAHQLLLKLTLDQEEKDDSNAEELKNTTNFDDFDENKPTYSKVIDLSVFAKSNKEFLEKLNENKQTSEFIAQKSTFDTDQEAAIKDDKRTFGNIVREIVSLPIFDNFDFRELIPVSNPFVKAIINSYLGKPAGSLIKDIEQLENKVKDYARPNIKIFDTIIDSFIRKMVAFFAELNTDQEIKEFKMSPQILFLTLRNAILSPFDLTKLKDSTTFKILMNLKPEQILTLLGLAKTPSVPKPEKPKDQGSMPQTDTSSQKQESGTGSTDSTKATTENQKPAEQTNSSEQSSTDSKSN